MAKRRIVGLTVAGIVLAGAACAHATESPLDNAGPMGVPRLPELGAPVPNSGPLQNHQADRPLSANPLWGIPLKTLNATRDRPLFRPSRRPPAPAVVAPVHNIVKPAPPPAEPERPQLRLVGVVAGASDDGFAVFISDTTHDIIPLKTGEGHGGWVLRSVKRREAVLEKGQRTVVIKLPRPTGGDK